MDTAKKLTRLSPYYIPTRVLYALCCAFFCSLYFARDILGIGISYYMIYLAALLIMAILPHEYVMIFFISISAFSNAGFNGVFSLLTLCVVFARFCRIRYRLNSAFLFIIFICLYEMVQVYSKDLVDSGVILTYVCLLLSLGILLQYPHEKIDKKAAMDSFICFSLFFAAMAFLILLKAFGSFSMLFANSFRTSIYTELSKDSSYLLGNQNYLTSLCSINLSLCILLFERTKKIRYLLASAFFIFSGLMTVSKMFIAVLLFLIAYTVFALSRKNVMRGFGAAVILSLILIIIAYLFSDTLIASIKERFATTDLTTGRADIISRMLAYMREHPSTYIFGTGILNLQPTLDVAVHSSVFEAFGGWGLFSLIFIPGYMISLLAVAHRQNQAQNSKGDLLNWLPFLTFLGYSIIGMLFSSALSLVKMIVCIFALEYRKGSR